MSIENPSVNRCFVDKHIDHIDHALGRPVWPLREVYRNHFATDANGTLAKQFEASPHWTKSGQRDDMAFYSVTDQGRSALADHIAGQPDAWQPFLVTFDGYTRIVPERTRSKAKYASYLAVSDSWSELTFGDFCKRSTVRRAA
ncbi:MULTISPECIES: hypothetical protein [unclassified Mesorhizobium]|uniref:hypothetical protein n=1 Tax=unclassified Mesorhizobium TaxID=325217 RepID=UPI00112AE29D|nr:MULTISPECIES: hypothetical protein [unclassified Mesorhizobium]MCA0027384.1 hypothetical protein [Mesorhizobium sp. B263B1A]TPJ98654.1 hypothetical protein FJ489_06935 [Mesorhizobium sp. B2-5-12]TPK28817.1 hypothetical protein FJ562_00325 [Mesorhizobium sp. B2-5-6]